MHELHPQANKNDRAHKD